MSLRLLKEKATLSRQLAVRARSNGHGSGARSEEQAERDEGYARAIQDLLETMPSALDQVATVAAELDGPGPGADRG